MTKNKVAKTFVYGLMILLFVGLGGFGAVNFSGTLRDLGTVGEKAISVDEYNRNIQRELRRISSQTGQTFTFEQAQSLGLDAQVLSQLITARSLENEASSLGISMGDEHLQKRLAEISAFYNGSGVFDAQIYRDVLKNSGLSAAEFEASLRDETAASILQGAVLAGLELPVDYAQTIAQYASESRDFTWAELLPADLGIKVGQATDEELQGFYDENAAAYTLPESKSLTYISILPDDLVDTVPVDDALLLAEYENRSDEYNQPERRIVDRLAFADAAEATAALEKINAGQSSFDALVTGRGFSLDDVALDPVSRADFGADGDMVFAASQGDVVGPVETSLGAALIRVNVVLDASHVAFDEVKDDLRAELAIDAARRQIDTKVQEIDDELAAGATLEELAASMSLSRDTIVWTESSDEGIAAYPSFRDAALAIQQGDFPEAIRLSDGGMFAMRLDAVNPATLQPFETVKDQVLDEWQAQELVNLLEQRAADIAIDLSNGALFTPFGLAAQKQPAVKRAGFVEGLPPQMIEKIFELDEGKAGFISAGGQVFVARVNEIIAADMDDPDARAIMANIKSQGDQALTQDILRVLLNDIQDRVEVNINQQAVNAVHAQIP